MDWLAIIREAGVIAGIAVFLVWATWRREQAMTTRIDALERFVQEELITIVRDSSAALKANTETLADMAREFARRPCMLDQRDGDRR